MEIGGKSAVAKKRRIIIAAAVLAVVLAASVLAVGAAIGKLFHTRDERAAAAAQNLTARFWNPDRKYFYCNSDHQVNSKHHAGPENGLYTDFWWEAQLWETTMDIYQKDGSAQNREMIGNVYDGFLSQYANWKANKYNDDIGWWAMACTRAYNLTGDKRYLTTAKQMFDFIYDTQWSDELGGGIWWNRAYNSPQKNVATNAPASITAARLSKQLNDKTYLEKSQKLYGWVRKNLYEPGTGKVSDHIEENGKLVGWEFTYNFGTFSGAGYELYTLTGEKSYLDDACKSMDWVISNKTRNGIMTDEGDGDALAFKSVYCRFLKEIADGTKRSSYQDFLNRNASSAWEHRRTSDDLIGPDWGLVPGESPLQSVTAAAGVSILQFAQPEEN